jgi:hypothetical protein
MGESRFTQGMDDSLKTSAKEGSLKKALTLFALLLFLGVFVNAQDFAAVRGKVLDKDGKPLPGATISLSSNKIGTRSVLSSEEGNFRFLNLPIGEDYSLKCELPGFKTVLREKLVVSFGRDITLDIIMDQTTIEETVTVIGQTPVIDLKRTQVGVNITEEMIMSLPTARNPWTLMTLVPGMLVAKEDVGGNEGGQQYGYSGHGSMDRDNTWNIDGANVTDNSALGAAPAYFNVAGYEEVQINYGNNDIKSQTGGVQINLVTRRGGNRYTGMFYLDVEDKKWQSSNVSAELKSFGYLNPGIDKVMLYGANFGGPIVKDKAWFYGSYGIQDLYAVNLSGTADNTYLNSAYGKLNFQLTKNTRAELFFNYDNKTKTGRNDYYEPTERDPETCWDQDGPGYTWKGELEQTFQNLYLNAKFMYIKNTFYLHPRALVAGQPLTFSYDPVYHVSGAMDDYGTVRDNYNLVLSGNYFAEKVLGGDHEIKFGVDVMTSSVNSFDYYAGNAVRYFYGADATMPSGEYWEVEVRRDVFNNYWMRRWSLFAQDTATFGRLTVGVGLRYDNETSQVKNQTVPASPFLAAFLPSLTIQKLDPGVSWAVLSPRINFIYDLGGNGKNVFKLSVARYGSQEGFGMANFLNPMGWGGLGVLWQDGYQNFVLGAPDGAIQDSELYGLDGAGALATPSINTFLWAWGVNVDDPTDVTPFNVVDPNYNSVLLDELTASYEREIFADFVGRVEFFYKKSHRDIWDRGMDATGALEPASNYVASGTDPVTGQTIYGSVADYFYRFRTNFPNRYARYLAGQIVLYKRLSHKWMLDASFTLSDWKFYYKGDIIDPQNVSFYEGGANSTMNSRWQFKISGLYQLPYGVNLSAVFRAREGYIRTPYTVVSRPNIGTQNFYQGVLGDTRLPNFYEADLRLEKMFNLSSTSRVIVAVDSFNATNSSHVLAVQDYLGVSGDPNPIFGRTTRILNPRVFRFGVRFEF